MFTQSSAYLLLVGIWVLGWSGGWGNKIPVSIGEGKLGEFYGCRSAEDFMYDFKAVVDENDEFEQNRHKVCPNHARLFGCRIYPQNPENKPCGAYKITSIQYNEEGLSRKSKKCMEKEIRDIDFYARGNAPVVVNTEACFEICMKGPSCVLKSRIAQFHAPDLSITNPSILRLDHLSSPFQHKSPPPLDVYKKSKKVLCRLLLERRCFFVNLKGKYDLGLGPWRFVSSYDDCGNKTKADDLEWEPCFVGCEDSIKYCQQPNHHFERYQQLKNYSMEGPCLPWAKNFDKVNETGKGKEYGEFLKKYRLDKLSGNRCIALPSIAKSFAKNKTMPISDDDLVWEALDAEPRCLVKKVTGKIGLANCFPPCGPKDKAVLNYRWERHCKVANQNLTKITTTTQAPKERMTAKPVEIHHKHEREAEDFSPTIWSVIVVGLVGGLTLALSYAAIQRSRIKHMIYLCQVHQKKLQQKQTGIKRRAKQEKERTKMEPAKVEEVKSSPEEIKVEPQVDAK